MEEPAGMTTRTPRKNEWPTRAAACAVWLVHARVPSEIRKGVASLMPLRVNPEPALPLASGFDWCPENGCT